MSELGDLGQKIKGKIQKAKGEIQQKTSSDDNLGAKIKGGVSKIKGNINEKVADAKLRTRRENRMSDDDYSVGDNY